MAARAIGSGTISFGLVSIPVKLYSSTRASAGVSFHMLHQRCGSRIRQQYVCPTCNESVERSDLVRGYEFQKDRYVTFTNEELKALEAKSTHAIEISEFVPLSTVDPIYFDRAYHLGPDKGTEKAYQLLTRAMQSADKVALAKHVMHGKDHLVILRAAGAGLVLHTAFFADEVRDGSDVERGAPATIREGEMTLAGKLIEELASDNFEPDKYRDEYRSRFLELVDAKVQGEDITAPAPQARRAQVIDLMDALKQSLAERGTDATESPRRRPARARPSSQTPRARKRAKK